MGRCVLLVDDDHLPITGRHATDQQSVSTDGALRGIITDRDIVCRCIAEGHDPRMMTAAELAMGTPIWVDANADEDEVLQLMESNQIRRLPVIEDHRLVGMISEADLARQGADAATGDHAGALARRTENDSRGVELAENLVRNRLAVLRHREDVLLRVLDGLRDRERNLPSLAVAETDAVDLVADDDEGREREPAAALDHLGHTVDLDHPFLQLAGLCDVDTAQNRSPPSRAPSASALTRPWKR